MSDGSTRDAPVRDDYTAFLRGKVKVAPGLGFAVDPGEVNPALKDFVQAIVIWAAAGGRRGIFSSFGLHKTSTQIELARLARKKTGALPLIVLPLGVRQEFFEEAEKRFAGEYAVELRFIRRSDEIDPADLSDGHDEHREPRPPRIYLTNYESMREGKIDAGLFGFVSLDEAACLRGFGGTKTFREFMARLAGDDRRADAQRDDAPGFGWGGVRYRFVATATPDPNEFIELLAYSAFLGVMQVGEAKTRFFKRDPEKADALTLHAHKAREFWLWVASWALFVTKPSDLGFSDDGYVMPAIDVRWHEVASDHAAAGAERDGQGRLFANAGHGVSEAAREKRRSLDLRVDKLMEVIGAGDDQCVIWCDLNDEQRGIERALDAAGVSHSSLYGSQDIDTRDGLLTAWKGRETQAFLSKPQMYGAGINMQQAHVMAFVGIGHKFHNFLQSLHRCQRFGQKHPVTVHLIYTEAERDVRRSLEAKWARHVEQADIMAQIVREYGLGSASLSAALHRALGVDRREIEGDGYKLVNNDCVAETRAMESCSVDLIVTSIPFSTQYEYTPSYNDFGHSEDNDQFWAQMDFLTPELLRVLKPGRWAVIHVKDRIVPGGLTGLGFQTVQPFQAEAIFHYRRHGFAYMGMKTVVTDVVRENNQTYRLGWTRQCQDATVMGAGLPEYLIMLRKPQTDRSRAYADERVVKAMPDFLDDAGRPATVKTGRPVPGTGYSRARWQTDAHAFLRSSGDRLLASDDLAGLSAQQIYRLWKRASLDTVYDFENHIALGEWLDARGQLPPTFMLLPPHSWHPDVWSDVTRMRTLNGVQYAQGKELHLCPIQFDLVDRAIAQLTMEGETVFDPFGGLGTVPYRAIALKRRGIAVELSHGYFLDAAAHCEAAVRQIAMPTLFDLAEVEDDAEASADIGGVA